VRFGGEAKVIRFPGHYVAAQASAGSLSREPTSGANIIEFHQRGHLADRQIAPQTALEVLADSNEYAVRMVENGIAGAAILALIAAGYWSLSTLVMLS
jgi:hypothetical protein